MRVGPISRAIRPASSLFPLASSTTSPILPRCALLVSSATLQRHQSTPLPRVALPSESMPRRHNSALNRIKRFWKKAEVKETDGGYLVALDNRTVKTPGGKPLLIPKDRRLLAYLIAGEWESIEKMRSYSIPLTSLAARAIEDLSDPEIREKLIQSLLKYFQTDTVCFREPYPMNLVEMQKKFWDPLITWVQDEFNCPVTVTDGIDAIVQSPQTVETFTTVARNFDPFELAAFERIVLNTKSFVISLAVMRRFLNVEEATAAARVELEHQIGRWGEVEDAHDVDREEIKRQIGSAVMALLKEKEK